MWLAMWLRIFWRRSSGGLGLLLAHSVHEHSEGGGRRWEVNDVRLGIQSHGAGADHGLEGLNDRQFVGSKFLGNSCGPVLTIGTESELGPRVKGVRIHAGPDGDRGHHFAGGTVHHDHLLVVATEEE